MKDYYKTEEGLRVTDKYKLKRLKTHYPELFPLDIPYEDKKVVLKSIQEQLLEVDFNTNILITCKEDLLKPISLFGLISLGKFVKYDFIGGYKLQDIYFDRDNDYVSLNHINREIMILYLGYREIHNKMQSEFVEHVLEDRYIKGKPSWVYFKGSLDSFRAKYSGALELIKNRNFNIVNINIPVGIGKKGGVGTIGNSSMHLGDDKI